MKKLLKSKIEEIERIYKFLILKFTFEKQNWYKIWKELEKRD